MSPGQAAWTQAALALHLLADNPAQLKGMTIRARTGPVRDIFLEALNRKLGPVRKIHPAMTRDALLGGLDFAGTLATGKIVQAAGALCHPGTIVFTMAERCPPETAALVAARLDEIEDLTLILLDEGADPDETVPPMLSERLAFHVSLEGLGRLEARQDVFGSLKTGDSQDVQKPVNSRKAPTEVTQLTSLAARLGIDTLRLPQFAVTTARSHARMNGRANPDADDIRVAAELVLAPRAKQLPEPEAPPSEQPEESPEPSRSNQTDVLPEDILIEAVRASLPSDLLEKLQVSHTNRAKGSGAGARRKGNRRGRPIPSRPGKLDGTSRLNLVATLRAAAPWQSVRGRSTSGPLKVYPSDVHLKRYEEKSDRLIIFSVDASGSAALSRLGEAKGAVELLLSRAYATRDHVALIAFRGSEAQLLLSPTRSLVQAKRQLAELPGGGGTPLAHGLRAMADLAQRSQSQGLSPSMALLTDGRANIALDGAANRATAGEDALSMARWIRSLGISTVVLDFGTRPQPALSRLAAEMSATYLPLPRATAERLSDALGTALDHGLGS